MEDLDIYFSADVETDGPIPGPFSMLSFALVYAGKFNGRDFDHPAALNCSIYRELKPISDSFELDALRVNGLDRQRLLQEGMSPELAMTEASNWVKKVAENAGNARPVLVAYPLSFDWSWLYWYFVRFSEDGSPFGHSACFDIKTAYAVKANLPIARAARSKLSQRFKPRHAHTHHALDDAIEQAAIFADVFEWAGNPKDHGKCPTF